MSFQGGDPFLQRIIESTSDDVTVLNADGAEGVDINATSSIGTNYSALQIAVVEGRFNIAKELIRRKCNILYEDLVRCCFNGLLRPLTLNICPRFQRLIQHISLTFDVTFYSTQILILPQHIIQLFFESTYSALLVTVYSFIHPNVVFKPRHKYRLYHHIYQPSSFSMECTSRLICAGNMCVIMFLNYF